VSSGVTSKRAGSIKLHDMEDVAAIVNIQMLLHGLNKIVQRMIILELFRIVDLYRQIIEWSNGDSLDGAPIKFDTTGRRVKLNMTLLLKRIVGTSFLVLLTDPSYREHGPFVLNVFQTDQCEN
jgi:hypothetical protein